MKQRLDFNTLCHRIMHRFKFRIAIASAALLTAVTPQLLAQQTLSLRDAIRMGLAQAPEAHVSSDRVDMQHAARVQAGTRPNPRLYLQSEDLRPWDHTFSFPDDTEDYGYVGETFELDGKRGKRIAYAEAGLRSRDAQHTQELQQIAAGIADAYWTAASTREAVTEWQKQLADFDRIVQYESDRVHSGATAGVDLLRTQVERDRITIDAAQARRAAQAAAIELARRTASLDARNAVLSDTLEQERPVVEIPLSTALEQRADVLAANDAVREAQADLRLQHANGVPNLDLLAGYKRDVGVNTVYGSLQWDLPIFNRNQGGVAAARANQQLAQDELDYTRMLASSAIETADADYRQEQSLVRDTLPGMEDRAQRNAAIIGDAYRSGGADLLRFLDAERVSIDARLLAIQTWTEYQKAVISLELAYGEEP